MSHFYDKEGKPQHFTKGANGKKRDSTLRDAKKHGWFPSVTGILSVVNKEGLNRWILNTSLEIAYKNPPHPADDFGDAEQFKEWSARIMKESKEIGMKAADIGTAIHNAIEDLWNGVDLNEDTVCYKEIAEEAINAICAFTQQTDFVTELTVAGDGYGGAIDLHNDDFMIDYKTKDITDKQWQTYLDGKDAKLAYPEMCMQLSAYDHAIGKSGRRLINVFVDRTIAGRVIIHEWDEGMYEPFTWLKSFWCFIKKHNP